MVLVKFPQRRRNLWCILSKNTRERDFVEDISDISATASFVVAVAEKRLERSEQPGTVLQQYR